LSSGNNFTDIDFTKSSTTLVVGHNGAGKSTMLDALSFGLFGKPHRKISKTQLVNTINNKGTLVEVEFSIGTQNYKIVRGIKPSKFEIWVGGNMLNQSSHAKEYQQMLEKNILKLTHKSFHQIVVLGSSSFVPFMQLAGGARREVIEDLLDINIFSKMNGLLKERMSILKGEITDNGHGIELIKTKINAQKKSLRELTAMNTAHRKEKEDQIETTQSEIAELNDFNTKNMFNASTQLDNVSKKLETLNIKKQKLIEFQSTFKSQIKTVVKEAKFFDENEICPTCDQAIDDTLRETKKSDAQTRAKELNDAITKSKEEMDKYESTQNELTTSYETARDLQNAVQSNQSTIARLQRDIDRIRSEIDDMSDTNSQFAEANAELEKLNTELESKQDEKYTLHEQYSYNQVSSELLKDSGIKTKIIKQYIPVINQLTNQYLQILDFFVHFDLDESFNETIRSRFRDNFSYDSFSEGEKQRIDLSLLFTWRQIAKMKNSVATNLLILDETFDSSLDDDGVDNLMKILYSLGEETNVFVISHKSELEDAQFQRKLEFVKEKNFSKLKAA
jgi:DNA repair exonuclease SbcCD ATPase subunit